MIRIVYDFSVSGESIVLNDKLKILLTLFHDFILSRVNILEDEIKKEPEGVIVINLFGTLRTKQGNPVPKGIHPRLFSDELRDKILGSFDSRDEIYIASVIQNALAELN